MSDTSKYTNAVPFFLAGEGAVLRYRTQDLITLEEKFGERFFEIIPERLNRNSAHAVVECLKAGLKQADGRKPLPVDFDDLPFSIWDARGPIFDAITMAITGQTFAAVLDAKKDADREGAMDPLIGSGTEASSAASSGPEIAQASADTTSSI